MLTFLVSRLGYRGGKLDHLDPKDPSGGPASQPAGENGDMDTSRPAPDPAMPGNVLIHNFPPAVDVGMKPFHTMMDRLMVSAFKGSRLKKDNLLTSISKIAIAASSAIIWFFTAFGSGWKRFVFRSILIGTTGFVATTFASLAQRKVEKEVERVRMDLHRQRGEEFSPPIPGGCLDRRLASEEEC